MSDRKYDNEVFYQVLRSGGNPDRIDYDRVDDSWARGYEADDAANRELRAQRRSPQPREPEDE